MSQMHKMHVNTRHNLATTREHSVKVHSSQGFNHALVALITGAVLHIGAASAQLPADTKFLSSAVENLDGTVSLPVYAGSSGGQTVYYIITEASDPTMAAQLGVNYAPLLANALDTAAAQRVSTNSGPYVFPATVTFNSGARSISPASGVLSPTPTGVPPARGNTGYSPLIQLPNRVVLNAPHVQNNSGHHPKLGSLNTVTGRAIFDETDGFQGGQPVRYISTDASTSFLAGAENAIYAPALQSLPVTAHADLDLFDNGQQGIDNIQRQGFDSAILDGLDPLNILEHVPSDPGYSPMWDVHVLQWSSSAQASRQRDFNVAEGLGLPQIQLAEAGPNGPVVNCPIVARRSTSLPTTFTPKAVSLSYTTTYSSYKRFTYAITADIRDGYSNNPASGVLVAISSTEGNTYSCTTDSTGRCSVNETLFSGGFDEEFYISTINHSPQAPGIAYVGSVYLLAPL